jgi:hypothetical protein
MSGHREMLVQIEKAYREWDPDARFASGVLAQVCAMASFALAEEEASACGAQDLALAAADCSALICEHATRLGLDPFAAATIARAVQARIMELSDVR